MRDDLEAVPLDELRRRRDVVREREAALSYRRRLLHAQLDIVAVAATIEDPDELEELLAEALTDGPAPAGADVRAVEVEGRDEHVDPLPEDLVGLSDEDRAALLERLRADEERTSSRRRTALDELDALQAELVRRYRRDGVDPRALLGEGR